jgi:hypothetical protein
LDWRKDSVEYRPLLFETFVRIDVSPEWKLQELDPAGDSPTLSSVIARLSFSDDDSAPNQSDLEFAASHFDEMTVALFESLSLPLADAILSEPDLRLTSEDFLYDMISSRFGRNPDSFELLDRVRFEYLSPPTIAKVIERSSEIFEHLNPAIWEKLCRRLAITLGPAVGNPVAQAKGSFSGIIAHLTNQSGGNVHTKGIVTVSASSARSGALSNVVDFSTEAWFSTKPEKSPWICYEFKTCDFTTTGFSVLLGSDTVAFLTNGSTIIFEISTGGSEWREMKRFSQSNSIPDNPQMYRVDFPGKLPPSRFARLRVDSQHSSVQLTVIAWEISGQSLTGRWDDEIPVQRFVIAPVHRAPVPRISPLFDMHFGVCAGGRPVPVGLDGISQFLSRAEKANVELSCLLPNRGRRAVSMELEMLSVQGVNLSSDQAWIQLHFPKHRIGVTHYAMAASTSSGWMEIPGWNLSYSIDGSEWTSVYTSLLTGINRMSGRLNCQGQRNAVS